jgi:hypothetical protein
VGPFVERAHFVGPDAARVDHHRRAHVDDAPSASICTPATRPDGRFSIATAGAWFTATAPCSTARARDREREPRVVGLGVVVQVRGREGVGPQRGSARQRVVADIRRWAFLMRQAAAEVVHPEHAAEQPGDATVDQAVAREHRDEERQDVHEVWRVAQRDLALGEGLAHEAELLLLQVADPAVHELRRARRRADGEVAPLHERRAQPAAGGVEGTAGPGDPAPDDDDVELLGGEPVQRRSAVEVHARRIPPKCY